MDMQDQPKYKYYRAGDKKFFADGASVRPIVEGTVPRQTGGEYRDREDYFYTGKGQGGSVSQLPGGGAQGGAQSGGVGAAVPAMQASVATGTLANATPNVRGNIAGGVPGAREAAATGGPDNFPITIDEAALRRGRERFQIYCTACHGMTGEGDGMIVRRGFRKPPSYYDDRLQEGTTPAAHFFDVITNGWGAMPDYAAQIPPEDRWKIIAYIRALQLSRKLNIQELSPEEQNRVRTSAQRQQQEGHEGGTLLQAPQGGEKH
ncbi:MAG TPA: c-type cytochrome [Pyrinomonadaceae bacterium]|nr:c-type cytochrome [Pyrinomonadaceae bacterium]